MCIYSFIVYHHCIATPLYIVILCVAENSSNSISLYMRKYEASHILGSSL